MILNFHRKNYQRLMIKKYRKIIWSNSILISIHTVDFFLFLDDSGARKKKVLSLINSILLGPRRSYFNERNAFINNDKPKLNKEISLKILNEKVNNNLNRLSEGEISRLNNPSLGIGYLNQKYPLIYKKHNAFKVFIFII